MNYNHLAKETIRLVGGNENVSSLMHCATRLRFKLKENHKANKVELEELEGVLSVVVSGGQFQVVIGNQVSYVYEEIKKLKNLNTDETSNTEKQGNIGSRIFEVISGSFSPLLPILAGAGMLKAVIIVLEMFGLISAESGTYAILSGAGNSIFYFLPVILGVTISIKLGANPYVGGAIGAALLEPNVTGIIDTASTFLGIPVVMVDYSSTVFPIFIAITIYSFVDKILKKVIYREIQLFVIPMLSLAIIVPMTVLLFGPFGTYVGNGLAAGISSMFELSGLLSGTIVGGLNVFLVVLGLHWGLVPIIIQNLAEGGDPLMPMFGIATFAQIGVAVGIFFKAKDKQLKALGGSTAAPGLFAGVTEPIIYGILLRYKRTLLYVVIAGAIGGAINGLFGVKMTSFAFHSVFAIPLYSPTIIYIISIIIAFGTSLLLTLFFGYETKVNKQVENEVEAKEPKLKKELIHSPLTGNVTSLSEVNDKVFSTGALGKGVAIEPVEGEVVAPVNGVVTTLFPTSHAIGITSDGGAEILIHIGIDTVELEGKNFTAHVEQGVRVTQGEVLVTFDIDKIKEAGYPVTTPVIITNTNNYLDVIETNKDNVKATESLLTLFV
jgi:beta-glucoside PTS system EIICBA component